MAAAAEKERAHREPVPIKERGLADVDHINFHRLEDGSVGQDTLNYLLQNKTTAVQEAAMPFAVSRTEHQVVITPEAKRKFMWLGRTAVENALSGYDFHIAEPARERVSVEVDEAGYDETMLRPGVASVFVSPRMSETDAPYAIAKQEHLGDDDSVRVSWLETKVDDKQIRVLSSLLVRDVPLNAWVAMLEDEGNIFGKSIPIENPDSALSVMKVHRELELPLEALPKGPVSLVEAVLPYIEDEELSQSVAYQLERYDDDQEDMRRKAESIAERWLSFDIALAESLANGRANTEIRSFIYSLQHQWGEDDRSVIERHELGNTQVKMTRELAAVLESAKCNLLWAPAAVITNNPEVLKQLDAATAQKIYDNEMVLQIAWHEGQNVAELEARNNRIIAVQNISVGGGCPGDSDPNFAGRKKDGIDGEAESANLWDSDDENKDNWKWTKGVCQVKTCSTRPGQTEVGPCSVCRKCQAKFDNGEDPTKVVTQSSQAEVEFESKPLFEIKAQEAAKLEDEDLTKEFYELIESETQKAGVY